jgi:hypothetical protein
MNTGCGKSTNVASFFKGIEKFLYKKYIYVFFLIYIKGILTKFKI